MDIKKTDEENLARLCSENNIPAQEELYRRYAGRLLTLCRRYSSDFGQAQDLMQDAFIRILDKIQSFRFAGKGSLYAWMSRVAINLALNDIRNRKLKFVSFSLQQGQDIPDPSPGDMEKVPQEKLLEFISCLPKLRRTVFNLYCMDGYSHREISEMLGITEKTSASTLAKARQTIKKKIYEYLENS